jgi:hypothetical protein
VVGDKHLQHRLNDPERSKGPPDHLNALRYPRGATSYAVSVANRKTEADRWFEAYLEQEGYVFEHEPPWKVRVGVETGKQPDYLIERDGQRAICEVKEFRKTSITDRLLETSDCTGVSVVSVDSNEMYGPVRRQVREAAKNLKPFANCGLPLVVVLCKPLVEADAHLEARHVISALFGNPIVRIPLSETGTRCGSVRFETGRDGALTTHHRYISAVVALHHRERRRDWIDQAAGRIKAEYGEPSTKATHLLSVVNHADEHGELPTGHYFFAESFENPRGTGPTLPGRFFAGAQDSRWAHSEGEQYERSFGPGITSRDTNL